MTTVVDTRKLAEEKQFELLFEAPPCKHMADPFEDAPVIYSYTRAQAIEDGVLIDVSETAKEAGFKFPIAVTSEVWHGYVEPSPKAKEWGQSERGRLWDILMVARFHAKGSHDSLFFFDVRMVMKEKQMRVIRFKALCHGGDDLEPVITISMPNED